jgi:hypothetical protein
MSANEDTGRGRRRHIRYQANWPAECIDALGFIWGARVLDHSLGGLGLENCPHLEVDQVIRVRLKSIGTFPCRVAWSSEGRCGVEFLPEANTALDADVASLAALLPADANLTCSCPRPPGADASPGGPHAGATA